MKEITVSTNIDSFIDKYKNLLNLFQKTLYNEIKNFKVFDLTYLISNNRMLDGMELVYLALIKNEDFSQSLQTGMAKFLEKSCIQTGSNFLDYEILFKPTFVKGYIVIIVHKKEKYWDEIAMDLYLNILSDYRIFKLPRYRKELNEPYNLNDSYFTGCELFDIDEITINDLMNRLFNNWDRTLIVSYLISKYKYNFFDAIKVIYFIVNKFIISVSL